MKNVLLAVTATVGIIIIRMILSLTVNEQAAEMFTNAASSFLFFYLILSINKQRRE